jgi:hypothetical protein
MKYKYCTVCKSFIEEKGWDCEPCCASVPSSSQVHKFNSNKHESVEIIKETYDYVTGIWRPDLNPSKHRKFLCIGGRYNKQRLAVFQAGSDYCQYNRGERRKKGRPNKAVLIHQSIL